MDNVTPCGKVAFVVSRSKVSDPKTVNTQRSRRDVCGFLVPNQTPAGQKTLKNEIWNYGMKCRSFHCQQAVLQRLVDGHQEPFSQLAGKEAVGSAGSVQRVRFL